MTVGASSRWRARLGAVGPDLWTIGALFALSRFHWLIDQYYHENPYATPAVVATLGLSLLLVLLGHVVSLVVGGQRLAPLTRMAVLTLLAMLALLQMRYSFFPNERIGAASEAMFAATGLALAATVAWFARGFWPRLRLALLGAAAIAILSPPVLAWILGKPIEVLPASPGSPRPVIVLLLDEFSAGGATEALTALRARGLTVTSTPVPSIGRNTIDVIPALFSGAPLPDAITCSPTAVCGSASVVDFARIRVARADVDIVGIYHRYCVIRGLRYCSNPESGPPAQPVLSWVLCSLPGRRVFAAALDCAQPARAAREGLAQEPLEALLAAPFWQEGGVLYAHLRLPHPPGAGDEPTLEAAYRHNLARATALVDSVVERLVQTTFGGDFALVVTSDHALRTDYWCQEEPYRSRGCEVSSALRGTDVPFIVAVPSTLPGFAPPRTNGGLFRVVSELAKRP